MAKYCNVAPYNIQMHLFQEGGQPLLGHNHLLLAHDIVQKSDEYDNLFGMRQMHPNECIILDNSAYELKSSVDSAMVWEAVHICQPNCVVLPDVYLDGVQTLEGTTAVLEDWIWRRANADVKRNIEFMAIPQGKTFAEWIWCAEQLAKLGPVIKWWGVPRNLREVLKQSRCDAIEILAALDPKKEIHLFGFSDDYVDDLIASQDPRVYSIDSTTPIRAGSLGLDFHLNVELPARGDWWDNAEWHPQIIPNLQYARTLFGRK
jgi:hypothetical protein